MLSVGVISAPRTPVYLRASIDSFIRQWDITPHVFLEPDALGDSRCHVHRNPHQLGCAFNWFEALRWMYNHTTTPYIMMCEDDIEWRHGASEQIRTLLLQHWVDTQEGRLKLADVGLISPYLSERNLYEFAPYYQWITPRIRSTWCGALCLIMPRVAAKYILEHGDKFAWYSCHRTPDKRVLHLDYAIGCMILYEMKKYIVAHNPTLILHRGDNSTFAVNNCDAARHSTSRMPAL